MVVGLIARVVHLPVNEPNIDVRALAASIRNDRHSDISEAEEALPLGIPADPIPRISEIVSQPPCRISEDESLGPVKFFSDFLLDKLTLKCIIAVVFD